MGDFLNLILTYVADKVKWKKIRISSNVNFENGNGFLGEFFLVTLINLETQEKLELAVKKAYAYETRRKELYIKRAFENEIYFYETIIPNLLKFMDEKKFAEPIDFFAKFYVSCHEEPDECLVMENVRIAGFDIIGRENFLDEEHVEFIFKTYAKFHAISFVFKDQKPEEYQKLKEGMQDFVDILCTSEGFQSSTESAFNCLDKELQEICKEFVVNLKKVFAEAYHYKGKYSCILHGDSWSNNQMFKYKNGKLTKMKLIDFQLALEGTPVYDLAYFLYAGGIKETYQNLEKYLQIYHLTFSKICTDLGSDPIKLYPYKALKEDWKKYSKFGLLMGMLVNKIKVVDESKIKDMVGEDFFNSFNNIKIEEHKLKLYRERMKDLLEDVYKKGFLIN